MAKIQMVDYESIPTLAKEMREYGKMLNNEMIKAYESVRGMHDFWYGKRYNELVKAFNNMVVELNEMSKLVVTDITYALEIIANNYSQADTGTNITTAVQETPRQIVNLEISNDVGMKFISDNVSSIKQNISTNFNSAKDMMNRIESTYGKITWQSEASEIFKTKFTTLKNNIVKSFEDINCQFVKLMQQAEQDIQNAENANTVS